MEPVAENSVPSLSIVFPTHNEEALIARALMEAVNIQQEYPAPVEIIVACNGCKDRSAQIARLYPVQVIEDERSGMSFGNNLGGKAAKHDLIFFWDVDTYLRPGALRDLAETVRGKKEVVGGFWAYPDKPSLRATVFYFIMNQFCRYKKMPPAGTTFISRTIYEQINGFDESIPQGTGSDLIRRGRQVGAEFTLVMTKKCQTSVRRFEKRGYARQLLEWHRNIKLHSKNQKENIRKHDYEVIR